MKWLPTRWLALKCAGLLMVAAVSAAHANMQSVESVKWLDAKQDPTAWAKVQAAFREELAPDDPATTYPQTAQRYKYLHRVAVFRDSALVIIGHRETKDSKNPDYFSAYNHDLKTKTKSEIADASKFMWQWKFVKLATFEAGLAPEVAFTYFDCWQCEPEKILGAFHFESASNRWSLRKWGSEKGVVVYAPSDPGGDTISFDCLFEIADVNGDGFDDVVLACREVSEPAKGERKITDSTDVYSFKGGQFADTPVTATAERERLWSQLCKKSPGSRLCNP
ncbi:MAG TPA: hypothetical protein VKR60_03035 [Candidatus Sulfotelmatobacter sp.]|nr:hypothetical protein [Candidatus Sulfotelmatobacter sp.]